MSYAWPGNVRELGAVIDRAAILGDGKRLEVAKALGVGTGPSDRAASGSVPGWRSSSPAAEGRSPVAPVDPAARTAEAVPYRAA